MPKIVPQNMKSINTINLQPDKMSSKMQIMIMMDIGGSTGKQIAEAVSLTESRVSIIRNSPIYLDQKREKWKELKEQVLEKTSDKIVAGDPVENKLKEAAMSAAEKIAELINDSNAFTSIQAAKDVLDRTGYKAFTSKTTMSVEVTDKMADRFERALLYDPPSSEKEEGRSHRIKIVKEE